MKYKYKIYGYDVESELELDVYEANFEQSDVTIKIGKVNKNLIELKNEWFHFSEKDNRFIFYIKKIGTCDIIGGKDIIIEPDEGALDSSVRLVILGLAFGILMQQRGVFPLHGSTVDLGDSCLTLIGHSRAGKTSLATGFIEHGFKLLADDVSRIGLIDDVNHVYPSYPSQRIWKDTVVHMGIEYDPKKYVVNGMDKFYVNDRNRFSTVPKPIVAVIEIRPKEDMNRPKLIQLNRNESLNILITHSYCLEMMRSHADIGEHLNFCSQLAMRVPVYRLFRPSDRFTVREQVDVLIKHFMNLI